jgi:putative superfamily III holin-X
MDGSHFARWKELMATATESDRSIGTIVKELMEHISSLFRSEIALLKWELKDTAAKLGGGAAMFAGALFVTFFGVGFLFVTIVLGLVALGVPPWLSSLIVTLVLFGVAAVLAIMGKKKFAAAAFVPKESVEHIKSDIEAIKSDISRIRSR